MFKVLRAVKEWMHPISNCLRRRYRVEDPDGDIQIQYLVTLDNVVFQANALLAHHVQIQNAYIGNHTSIGRYTKIRDCNVGQYCSVSWDVTLGAVAHPMDTITSSAITYRRFYGFVDRDTDHPQKKTIIGNDVWIGCGVTVVSGVVVGDGAVIGAGAVVTKDVPPYAIVGGVPARIIGWRFTEPIRELLEDVCWWNWPREVVKANIEKFGRTMTLETAEWFASEQKKNLDPAMMEENCE